MGWECPHLFWIKDGATLTNMCRINKEACTPTKGKCVLRGKVKLISESTGKPEKEK